MKQNFTILFLSILFSACALDDTAAIDALPNPPVLSGVAVSPDFINTAGISPSGNSLDTLIRIRASLLLPVPRNTTVTFVILSPDDIILASGTLQDTGGQPDSLALDGVYAAYGSLSIPQGNVGNYTVAVQAVNGQNERSSYSYHRITVINTSNAAPILSSLAAPDTVYVPAGSDPSLVKVSVMVADSQGLADVSSVSLQSRRPDSTIVGVFSLYDDGGSIVQPTFGITSGDSSAQDGRYTLTIPIFSSTQKNTYRDFYFYAQDRSGAVSDTLKKRVYIQ